MRIWRLRADVNNYDSFTFANKEDSDLFSEYGFNSTKIGDRWKELEVEIYSIGQLGDILGLPGVPVFNLKTVNALRDLIKDKVELLPLKFNSNCQEYFIINVLDINDCINYEKSIVKKFPDSNKVMRFIKYYFKYDIVKNSNIFKIPELPKAYVFVSDLFRHTVLSNNLKGFLFEEVWNSEIE